MSERPEGIGVSTVSVGDAESIRPVLPGVDVRGVDVPLDEGESKLIHQSRAKDVRPARSVALLQAVNVAPETLAAAAGGSEWRWLEESDILKRRVAEQVVAVGNAMVDAGIVLVVIRNLFWCEHEVVERAGYVRQRQQVH